MRWQQKAACRDKPTRWWYAPPIVNQRPTWEHEAALLLCLACPVQAECADAKREDDWGMWGAVYHAQGREASSREFRCRQCDKVFELERLSGQLRWCESCLLNEKQGRAVVVKRESRRRVREREVAAFEAWIRQLEAEVDAL